MLNLAGCKAKKNHEGISWFTWWNWGSPDGTDGSSLIRHETRICGGKILLARGQWPPSTWIFVMKYILIYPKTNAWNTWNGDLEDVLSNFWKKTGDFFEGSMLNFRGVQFWRHSWRWRTSMQLSVVESLKYSYDSLQQSSKSWYNHLRFLRWGTQVSDTLAPEDLHKG